MVMKRRKDADRKWRRQRGGMIKVPREEDGEDAIDDR